MKRCLPFVLLLTLGSVHVEAAESRYQVGHSGYGCVDPRATLALSGRDARHHPRGWASSVRQAGRCFLMTPSLHLDIITRNAGLALVRRVPPRIGEPPIYVMASDLRTARAPAPDRNRAGAPGLRQPEPQGSPATVVTSPGAGAMAAPIGALQPAAGPPGPPASAPDTTAQPSVSPASSAPEPAAEGPGVSPAVPSPVAAAPTPLPPGPDAAASGIAPASTAPQAAPDASVPTTAAPVTMPAVEPASPVPNVPAPTATAPVAPAPWPPQQTADAASAGPGLGVLVAGLAMALLLAFIAAAWIVARRRREFARVETDWPSPTGRVAPELPIRADERLYPTLQAFRRHCANELERAGWVTQLAFPGDGSGPDIVCRQAGRVLAVRCRLSPNDITSEMVDEAALMGTRQAASDTMLTSNARFSQRARDEAMRHRIHLLRDSELSVFVV